MKIKRSIFILLLACTTLLPESNAQQPEKRAFRGAWVHTVAQSQYAAMDAFQMKAYFSNLLDRLQQAGINTILFQVRPEADAWFESTLEPWSRYITGTQGKHPNWDPLLFLIGACHERNMDIHAWINPYRVRNNPKNTLAPSHLYHKNPSLFVEYGNYLWFDPGNPLSRKHILKVVEDLVRRYDLDGIHMDDYFYPYPIKGVEFDDKASFHLYGKKAGYNEAHRADWRRNNVNQLVKELQELIHKTKPWVQFGISPFGIYRNQKPGINGSATRGLSNYDDLYADVLLWMQKGWVDYVIPQLYWEINHGSADYNALIDWWTVQPSKAALYIGQDVVRTMAVKGELKSKMKKAQHPAIQGHCYWPAYEILKNTGGIADSLKNRYHRTYALPPAINRTDSINVEVVQSLRLLPPTAAQPSRLQWDLPKNSSNEALPFRYVIYGFQSHQKTDLNNPTFILGRTINTHFNLPLGHRYERIAVTALDRAHNEGPPVFLEVKQSPTLIIR